MTVCIAAIYNNNAILGISDKMITAGDIQFEPPASKIVDVTNSIAVMAAGDSNIQTQLLAIVSPIIIARIKEAPDKWIPVADAATLYRDTFVNIRANLAEKAVLSPLGLTYPSFISKQKFMSEDFINDISYKLKQFSIEPAHTIVTGIDETGPHIYVIRDDNISCDDRIGFAAVGIGSNHAISHFMLSGYAKSAQESKALLTIHQAKKKSEASPGVGENTDMFVLGPNLGTFNMFIPLPPPSIDIVKDMDDFYKKYKSAIDRLDMKTEEKIKNYIQTVIVNATPAQQAEVPVASEESTVKKPTKPATPTKSKALAMTTKKPKK